LKNWDWRQTFLQAYRRAFLFAIWWSYLIWLTEMCLG
jgi:hypothetical protein